MVMNTSKKLIIISGVTGAIGSALLSEYAQGENNVIYGISRKALSIDSFLEFGKLPQKTLICSIDYVDDYSQLFRHIDFDGISEVIYIHAFGLYPFEVNKQGKIVIENDLDGDGINDEVKKLTYSSFVSATENLLEFWKGKTECCIFAGIADKYEPAVHQSWWRTIKEVKKYMIKKVKLKDDLSMFVFNISSLICPHELITRPFVFIETDADQTYWLQPHELSKFVISSIENATSGFSEVEKFRIKPNFLPNDYYSDTKFTPRKTGELFGKK